MRRVNQNAILILLATVPTILFAQQAQQADGQPARRMSELIDNPVSYRAGDFDLVIGDLVLTVDGALTHLVVEAAEAAPVQTGPGTPGTRPEEDRPSGGPAPSPGAVQDPTQAPGDEPRRAPQFPIASRYLVLVDRVTFGRPDQATAVDLGPGDLDELPAMSDDRLPADLVDADTRSILGSRLRDFTFVDAQGEKLGDVDDVVLDLQRHRVVYIALATGGVLGIGRTLHAVPLEAVRELDTEEERIVVDISRERLEEREGFDADNWPAEAPAWENAAEQPAGGRLHISFTFSW
jgi:sporulation protein YlmC with PRC-barrel domain